MLINSSLLKNLGIAAAFSLIVACANTKTDAIDVVTPAIDTQEWANWVEQKIPTTDNAAHGPDVGEAEWCGVIEKKLFKSQSGLEPCSVAWRNKVTDALSK